jgi:hypothetical protein
MGRAVMYNKNNGFCKGKAHGLLFHPLRSSEIDLTPQNPLIFINNQWQYYALDWDKIQQDFSASGGRMRIFNPAGGF